MFLREVGVFIWVWLDGLKEMKIVLVELFDVGFILMVCYILFVEYIEVVEK